MVAWNPGTPGPSARLTSHLLQNRHQAKNNGGEIVCCLAKCVLGTDDDTHNEERSDFIGEKWIADSGASFHMTHLADLLSDVRLGNDKVRGGDGHLIEVVGYGTLTVVFPEDLTVKLLDVCLLYTSPSPRDKRQARMPSSA